MTIDFHMAGLNDADLSALAQSAMMQATNHPRIGIWLKEIAAAEISRRQNGEPADPAGKLFIDVENWTARELGGGLVAIGAILLAACHSIPSLFILASRLNVLFVSLTNIWMSAAGAASLEQLTALGVAAESRGD